MKKILFSLLGSLWIITLFSVWYSCAAERTTDYTDRQVGKAIERIATRWDWADRKPLLERLESVIPKATERLKDSPTALALLEQIWRVVNKKLEICISEEVWTWFASSNLNTNTNIRSIELNQVLSWGPPKDGIPALNAPTFIDIATANNGWYLTDTSEWIVIAQNNISKFYPYQILNRHEIVNDSVWDSHIAITFCPLCGTAIVFNREFDGEVINFWVSWKLYNSNLLMYDDRTESLRSQAIWRGVVGFYTDFQLEYIDSDVLEYNTFKEFYPDGLVLSDDTWYSRNYKIDSPYGDYESNDDLYFPVENSDATFPKKTILYVVNDTEKEISLWFLQKELAEAGSATLEVEWTTYLAKYTNWIVTVYTDERELQSFTQMWFSRTAHENYPRHLWEGE